MSASTQSAADQNFTRSGGAVFKGIDLEPFTARRQAVATEMGMKWPYIDDGDLVCLKVRVPLSAEEIAALPKSKQKDPKNHSRLIDFEHYKQSYRDSVIALWLCSQPLSRIMRAERKTDEALDDAWTWAQKVGLSQGTEAAGEALGIWLAITRQIAESKSEPRNKNGAPPEEDDERDL